MSIIVRPALAQDVGVIVTFNQRLAQETEDKILDPAVIGPGVEALLADPVKGAYFIAEEDGDVLGQLMITREWSDWRNGWMWWIQSVYVQQSARRRGVFRALFEHVEQAAMSDPEVVGMRLYVELENAKAQETYRVLGMEDAPYRVMEKSFGSGPI